MFEDSLVESQSRIRTRSSSLALGSFLFQAALLLLFILYPLFHPDALPRQSIERLLVAPPPQRESAPTQVQHATAPGSTHPLPSLKAQLQVPRTIPARIASDPSGAPPPSGFGGTPDGDSAGVLGAFPLSPASPVIVAAKPTAPKRPLPVSSGVAAGQLLNPIRPTYPEVAKQARIQGTVVIEATISRQGTIENLQVIEGQPLLRQAAIDAVAAARYRPFLLNGEPVEVQTSIRVIFSLGG